MRLAHNSHTVCEWHCEVCGGEISIAFWEGMPRTRCEVCRRIVCSSCTVKRASLWARKVICKSCAQQLKEAGRRDAP
jgi:hypothetical protein